MSEQLKLVHVEAGRHLYGGAQQVLYLLERLQAMGHHNTLVCPPGAAIADAVTDLGIPVWAIGPSGDLDLGFSRRLATRLSDHGADLLHLHSRRGADVWGARAGKRAGVPAVISRRVDNPEPRWLSRWRYRHADRVVTISDGIRAVLTAGGVDPARLRVVRSAVDPAPFRQPAPVADFRQRFSLDPGGPVAGVIAQLIPRKGHRVLIEALVRLGERAANLQVLCLGRGPELAGLERAAADAGLGDRVQFPGFVDDLPAWLAHFDFIVHPALMEGLGVSLLQASAAGVPVIATRAGGMPEAVRDGVNGRLVAPGDADELASAIDSMLGDENLRERLGRAGSQLIDAEFSTEAMARGNLAVYRELLAAR